MLAERDQLPVKQFEEVILSTINSNPVVLIRGATGCGKTTQVPQFILDSLIKGGRGSDCNIVVTQVCPHCTSDLHFCLKGLFEDCHCFCCSPEGSALYRWLSESLMREEKILAKAVAIVYVLSLSFLGPMPASSSALWVGGCARISSCVPKTSRHE